MKIAKQKPLSLPLTRRGYFSLAMRYHKMALFKLTLIGFLFLLVPMAFGIYALIAEGAILSGYLEDAEAQWAELLAFRRLSYLMLIPAFALAGLYLSGCARVYRRFAYNEGYVLKDDFVSGIKENWKGNLGLSLLYGVLAYFLYFPISLISGSEGIYLHYGLLIVYFVLLALMSAALAIGIFLRDIYTNAFWGYLKAAWQLLFRYLHYGMPISLMASVPFALFFLLNGVIPGSVCIIAVLILCFLYAFAGFALAGLASFLLFAKMADESINKKAFPAQYRKGLYDGEEDA